MLMSYGHVCAVMHIMYTKVIPTSSYYILRVIKPSPLKPGPIYLGGSLAFGGVVCVLVFVCSCGGVWWMVYASNAEAKQRHDF